MYATNFIVPGLSEPNYQNKVFLVNMYHQLALVTSLPFVHVVRTVAHAVHGALAVGKYLHFYIKRKVYSQQDVRG